MLPLATIPSFAPPLEAAPTLIPLALAALAGTVLVLLRALAGRTPQTTATPAEAPIALTAVAHRAAA